MNDRKNYLFETYERNQLEKQQHNKKSTQNISQVMNN